ncbi:MAG: hypothetical protein Q8L20_10705 [Gammaproteobacteria bacterium]|nr:hypothetical protein [Gammaproteobacteria bacterium]
MASRSLGSLTIDLLLKMGGFEVGMDKAARTSRSKMSQIEKDLNKGAKAAAAFAIAGVAAGAALIKSSINQADAFSKQSQIVGVAIDDLSGLAYGADLAGVSFEQLSTGLTRSARAIEEASQGSGAGADAYAALGIKVRDSNGVLRSNMEILEDVADRFAGMEDGAIKTALAQDILGRSGAKLIPLLNGGRQGLAQMRAEAERMGQVFDEKTGKAAEEFNDNLNRMGKVISGTGNQLAQDLLPQMVEFTDLINEPATQESIRLVVTGIADIAISAANAAKELVQFSKWLGEAFAAAIHGPAWDDIPRILEKIEELESRRTRIRGANAAKQRAEMDEQISQLRTQIDLVNSLRKPAQAGPDVDPVAGVIVPKVDVEANAILQDQQSEQAALREKLNKDFATRIAQYQEQLALVGEITELERLRYDVSSGSLVGLDEEQTLRLENLAIQLDALAASDAAAEKEKERLELFTSTEDAMEREIALYGEITEADRIRFETTFGNLVMLDEAQKARLISLAEEIDVLDAAKEADKVRAEQIKKNMEEIEEFGKQAARNIQNNFAEFLFDPFDEGLKGMLKSLGDTVRKAAAEVASQKALKFLFGGLAGNANPILAAFGGMFDSGGTLPAGKWGIAGEYGPEIIRGPAAITGRAETARMMGGAGVQVNIINNAGVQVTQGTRRMEGGRMQQDIIIEAVRGAITDGSVDDVLAGSFGLSRARGAG